MSASVLSTGKAAYRSHVGKQLGKVANHTINIFIVVDEAMALAVGDLSNDIKSQVLQPLREITDLARCCEEALGLSQEDIHNFVDKGFILDKGAHGESTID